MSCHPGRVKGGVWNFLPRFGGCVNGGYGLFIPDLVDVSWGDMDFSSPIWWMCQGGTWNIHPRFGGCVNGGHIIFIPDLVDVSRGDVDFSSPVCFIVFGGSCLSD